MPLQHGPRVWTTVEAEHFDMGLRLVRWSGTTWGFVWFVRGMQRGGRFHHPAAPV